jgi:predicted ArsR family transcriptional regulator
VHQQHARALLHETIGFLMRQMYVRFTAAAVHDDPMSRDLVVLDTLADQDAASQQDLAERLGINRAIMVRVIDRLEHVGHVRRMRNPGNRRV